jgi:hypothetical protein
MSLAIVHARLANTALLYFGILFIWGLWQYFRKEELGSSYWGALVIGQILVLAQGVLGIILYIIGLQASRGGMHILYGIVAALGIPAVYVFTKGRNDRNVVLIYAAVTFLCTILFLRSMTTG